MTEIFLKFLCSAFFLSINSGPWQNKDMNTLIKLITLILLSFVLTPQAEAQDKGSASGIFQRASQRETKRWTLQEWMETKEKNRMMDLWLALNSPSPYEGIFGLHYFGYQTTVNTLGVAPTSWTGQGGHFSAYASIIGLSFDYNKFDAEKVTDTSGQLNFRVFGNSVQSTHLTLHLGQRTRNFNTGNQDFAIRNTFAQASLQLYFSKYFGLDGNYRVFQPTTEATLGEIKGQSTEAGLFIDFSAFRVYGCTYRDQQIQTLSGSETHTERSGIKSGFKIFY